jgi:hypothetical protein
MMALDERLSEHRSLPCRVLLAGPLKERLQRCSQLSRAGFEAAIPAAASLMRRS